MDIKPDDSSQQPRSVTAQWLALLGPPSIWLLQFQARYALAGNAPGSAAHVSMVLIGVTGMGLVAACGLAGYREWRLAEASPLDRFAGAGGRARFMGALGLFSACLFFLVIVAQLLPGFFIPPGKS